MIKFKENVQEVLPYNRERYLNFLDDDLMGITEWNGISFQLGNNETKAETFVENYEALFKNVISKFDDKTFWIINHDDKDLKWFPNEEHNLIPLRELFTQNKISQSFIGALIFTLDDLLKFSKDLISYPSNVFKEKGILYKNLDISHSKLQFIIKISGHNNIDFLSTNKNLLKQIINENSSGIFKIKLYKGTYL